METLFVEIREALAGRYDVRRVIGTGGMATVFRAWDRTTEQQVAIKVLKPELASGLPRARFQREAELASKLNHPNIVPIVTHGEAGNFSYIVMPFIEGETLRTFLRRDRTVPLPKALQVARDVASALAYAHDQHIMHRDIKPENIILSEDGAVVADFGIARVIADDGNNLTLSGTTVGTLNYMSPEQAHGTEVDGRTDIYSLGCVMFEMIAGRRPFSDLPSPFARRPDSTPPHVNLESSDTIPDSIDSLISRSLEWVPEKRFSSAREIDEVLRQAQQITGLPYDPAGVAGQARGWIVLGSVAAAIVAGAFLISRTAGPFAEPRSLAVQPLDYQGPGAFQIQVDDLNRGIIEALRSTAGVDTRITGDSAFDDAEFLMSGLVSIDSVQGGPVAILRPLLNHRGQADTLWIGTPDTIALESASINAAANRTAAAVAARILGLNDETSAAPRVSPSAGVDR